MVGSAYKISYEFDEFNGVPIRLTSTLLSATPLRERLFNGFIGGSFFMWNVLRLCSDKYKISFI
jgi:hypothetical protein